MDSYRTIITYRAKQLLNSYVDYIQYTLKDNQAADSVFLDAIDTIAKLEDVAESLQFCDSPELREMGYRKVTFLRHKYVMLYRVIGDTAYIEAIYHQLQDYEKLFMKDFGIK